MGAKEINRQKLLEYLGNPENEFLGRNAYAVAVLGYKQPVSMYKVFSPTDLDEIEAEAFEIRKKRCVKQLTRIYGKLYQEAQKGSITAAKEFLNRVEGKVSANMKHNGNINIEGFQINLVRPTRRKES